MIEYENLNRLNARFHDELKAFFQDFLESGYFVLGKSVRAFEEQFRAYCGAEHFLGVASGQDALFLSLKASGIPAGSEVLVPSNTYIATILPVLHADLHPILVDPDLRTYNLDAAKIVEAITPKTKAIVAVHLYGKPCRMDQLVPLAQKHGLTLIEDCAQAHGAAFKNKKVGTFGDYGAFSFYPTKNLGALGDAGGVATRAADSARTLRQLRNYGSETRGYSELVGFNSRLDEVQAGFLTIKLKHLDEINQHKRRLAGLYLDRLNEDFVKPVVEPDCHDVYHVFNIRHEKRDRLREYLLKNEIQTEIHFPTPPHRQPALRDILGDRTYPISEEIHATTLSLPISFCHDTDDIERVIDVMNRF